MDADATIPAPETADVDLEDVLVTATLLSGFFYFYAVAEMDLMDVVAVYTMFIVMSDIVLSSYCFCYADAVEIISADSYFSFYYFKKLPFLRQLIFCMKFY